MTLAIEIYDERELCPETLKPEPDAEAMALIQELGLAAQRSTDGARIAYPNPTADQMLVLMSLFSAATKLEEYDAGCIPLRMLKEIRSYKAENPTHTLYIRHSPPAQVRDPVLLAYTGIHAWMWDKDEGKNTRLIARWGDALEPWGDLLNRAQTLLAKRATAALDQIIRKATELRQSVDAAGAYGSSAMPELNNMPQGW